MRYLGENYWWLIIIVVIVLFFCGKPILRLVNLVERRYCPWKDKRIPEDLLSEQQPALVQCNYQPCGVYIRRYDSRNFWVGSDVFCCENHFEASVEKELDLLKEKYPHIYGDMTTQEAAAKVKEVVAADYSSNPELVRAKLKKTIPIPKREAYYNEEVILCIDPICPLAGRHETHERKPTHDRPRTM